jgi:hypothetical protein
VIIPRQCPFVLLVIVRLKRRYSMKLEIEGKALGNAEDTMIRIESVLDYEDRKCVGQRLTAFSRYF